MKRSWKIALLVLLATLVAVFAISCGSVESISISKLYKYKSTYVLGQELDLSGGALIVNDGKTTTEIPLQYEEIKVSGYDKDRLGQQRLTVEYKGAKTFLTVSVVERMVFSGVTTDYLVGDSLDTGKGKITVTKDDGTSVQVALTDKKLTVSGFDSAEDKMGSELTFTYKDGANTYEATYKVNIHPIDEIEFKKPSKITYPSHYTTSATSNGIAFNSVVPDTTGGEFIIKGNNGKIQREFDITPAMVSGLDLSVVNAENPSVDQTLTVTFLGKEYKYDIKIVYSDVSRFRDNSDKFSSIDFKEGKPEISKELGELALELARAYTNMSFADRATLGGGVSYPINRTAFIYGYDLWVAEMEKFRGVFGYTSLGAVMTLESYETVKASLEMFEDEESPLYTLPDLLIQLIDDYTDDKTGTGMVVWGPSGSDNTFDKYSVLEANHVQLIHSAVLTIIDVYDTVKNIPRGWTPADLKNHATAIESACVKMMSDTNAAAFPNIYYSVSEWRGGDLFDIIFTYLYDSDKITALQNMTAFGLPSAIKELYEYLSGAAFVMDGITIGTTLDTTNLFFNYYHAKECAEAIEAMGDTAEKYLYDNMLYRTWGSVTLSEAVTFPRMLNYVCTSTNGFYSLSAGLLGNSSYEAFMDKYMTLLKNLLEEGYDDTAEYGSEVRALFNMFANLSPAEQYSLICSFNYLYSAGSPEFAFDDSEGKAAFLFAVIVNNYMKDHLPDTLKNTYDELIRAIEIYANRFGYDEWESDFIERMDKINGALANKGVSEADRAVFDTYLGAAYSKYAAIRESLKITTPTNLGDWQDEFDAMNEALVHVQTALGYLNAEKRNYSYFLAAFEKAEAIARAILEDESVPESVKNAFFREALFEASVADGKDGSKSVMLSYDFAITSYRNIYVDTLVFLGRSDTNPGVNVYDTYEKLEMGNFLVMYYDVLVDYFSQKEDGEKTFTKSSMLALLDAYRLLEPKSKALFGILEGDIQIYRAARSVFLSEELTTEAATTAGFLFDLEDAYSSYKVSPGAVTLTAVNDILAQLKACYAALEGESKTSFADFEAAYAYYVGLAEGIEQ